MTTPDMNAWMTEIERVQQAHQDALDRHGERLGRHASGLSNHGSRILALETAEPPPIEPPPVEPPPIDPDPPPENWTLIQPGQLNPSLYVPGARLLLAPGEHGRIDGRGKSGTEDAIIWIKGQPGAHIQGLGYNGSPGVDLDHSNWWRLEDLDITSGIWGVIARWTNHLDLIECDVHRTGQSGVQFMDDSHHLTMVGGSVAHTGQRPGEWKPGVPYRQFGEGIYIGNGWTVRPDTTSDIELNGVEIAHTSAEAVDFKPGLKRAHLHHCHIHDIDTRNSGAVVAGIGHGSTFDQMDVLIEHNVIEDITSWGPEGWQDANGIAVSTAATIYTNTLRRCADRGILIKAQDGHMAPHTPVSVHDNVVVDTATQFEVQGNNVTLAAEGNSWQP